MNACKILIIIILCINISCDSIIDDNDNVPPPVINQIETIPETSPANRVSCGDTVQIIVDATCPNKRDINYSWEAPEGYFDNNSNTSSVNWISPVHESEEAYEILVTVSNGVHEIQESITIYVASYGVPVVKTTEITHLTDTSAVGGGTIIDCGLSEVNTRGVVYSLNEYPTLENYKTVDGSGPGFYTSEITGLYPATTYYIRAYATNNAGTGYGPQLSFTTKKPILDTQTITDIDGNVYTIISIGDQFWMAENLRTTRYRNGDIIPNITDNQEWQSLTTGAWVIYDNDHSQDTTYGKLYNWYAVDDERGLCPEGWHVPSDEEWKKFELYLGMPKQSIDEEGFRGSNEGGKIKSTRTVPDPHPRWNTPNLAATNETGFSAVPGGYRNVHGYYDGKGSYAYFWPSLPGISKIFSWNRELASNESGISRGRFDKRSGFSVRCIRN